MHFVLKRVAIAGLFFFTLNQVMACPSFGMRGYQTNGFTEIDSLVLALVQGIDDDSARARVIHDWIAANIDYDLPRFNALMRDPEAVLSVRDPSQSPGQVYHSRLGICEGYANLFSYMCRRAGMTVYVVEGLGRPLDDESFRHGWNAVLAGGRWRLVDVTWAAGGIDLNKNRFSKKLDRAFFMMAPEEFIRTHYPSDPAWQLLERPVTRMQFEQSRFEQASDRGLFHYADTISGLFRADSVAALRAVLRRTLAYDPSNNLAKKNMQILDEYVQNLRMAEVNLFADTAVSDYNECLRLINAARADKNVRLMDSNESTLKRLMERCRKNLNAAIAGYREIRFTDRHNSQVLATNLKNMQRNLTELSELERYVRKYFDTPGQRRKSML